MVNPLLELCQSVPVREFEPGAPMLAEGKTSGLLYVLIDGDVEIVKGDFQINIVSDPGAIFGEISVLLDIPHMATVRALSRCRAHEIRDGNEFLKAHQEIAYHLAQLLARRLQGVSTYLVDLKQQFASQENHLAMVDDVLETLVHQQHQRFMPGSDRDPGF
jgi:CRP/FNR family cyclic AMP-dependent transcriptional regulator